MQANNVPPSIQRVQPFRHCSDSELLPSFTLPQGFIWDATPEMSGTAMKWKVQDLSRLLEAKSAKRAARMLPRSIFPLI